MIDGLKKVSRFFKFRKIAYYRGEKCVCKNKKRKMTWCCLECKKIMTNSPEEKELAAACSSHFLAAEKFLNKIKYDNKNAI